MKVGASWQSTGSKFFGKMEYPVIAIEFVVDRAVSENTNRLQIALDEHLKRLDEYHDTLLKQYDASEP